MGIRANAEGYEPEYGPNAPVYEHQYSSEPTQYYWPEYQSKTIIYKPPAHTMQVHSSSVPTRISPRMNLRVLPSVQNRAPVRQGGDPEFCTLQVIRLMEKTIELLRHGGNKTALLPHLRRVVNTLQNLLNEAGAGVLLWTKEKR